MKRLALIALVVLQPLLTAASCATTSEPKPVTLAVAVSCVPLDLAAAPADLETVDSLGAAPDAADRYKRLYADWKRRAARMLETEPVIAGCR